MISTIVLFAITYWLISPLFIDKEINESLEDITNHSITKKEVSKNSIPDSSPQENISPPTLQIIATGRFEGKSNHRASGSVSFVEIKGDTYLRIEDSFDAENGPDLFVHLGKDGEYISEINLGKLKGNKGGQNYLIPKEINLVINNEVWIWCRAFSVPFAQAILK